MTAARTGRTRGEAVRHAILVAARGELAEHGYDKFSIDRVAGAAGVGKQTVYRRYSSKNALVADCILRGYLSAAEIVTPHTGDIRGDISTWAHHFATLSAEPDAIAIALAGTAATAEDSDIAARYHEQIVALTETALTDRLHEAEEAGQLRPGTPANTVVEAIVGALLYRILTRQPLTTEFVDQLMGVVFDGIEA